MAVSSESRFKPRSLGGLEVESPRWGRPLRIVVLAAADMTVIAGAVGVAMLLWATNVRNQPPSLYLELWPCMGLFLFVFALLGLYPGFGVGAVETLRRLTLGTSSVFLVLAAITFVLKVPQQYSRVTVGIAWLLCIVALPISRYLLLSLLVGSRWWGEPAILVGSGELAQRIVSSLNDARSLGYRPIAVLPSSRIAGERFSGLPLLHDLAEVEALGRRGVRIAIVADEEGDRRGPLLEHLRLHFRHVILIRGSSEVPLEGVVTRDLGGVLGIEFRNQLLRRRNRILKRAVDLTLGSILLLLVLPLLAVLALIVRLSSRGPALFSQVRSGLGGKPFRVWKLRTMYVDAEDRLQRLLDEDSDGRSEWQSRFKLRRDPRVVPLVGRLLRRFSLDELPQLWNVVRGEMSLVGPRPFPEYHLERFSDGFRALRHRVRPGLTGLWQVMVRSAGTLEDQESLDAYYIRNWSIWMDLYVLARTTLAVIAGRGAA